jgi:hypothetical protein
MEVAVGLVVPESIVDDKTNHTIISISIWENKILTYEENNFVWEENDPDCETRILVDSNEGVYVNGEQTWDADNYCFETHRLLYED